MTAGHAADLFRPYRIQKGSAIRTLTSLLTRHFRLLLGAPFGALGGRTGRTGFVVVVTALGRSIGSSPSGPIRRDPKQGGNAGI
jgi:hypothetical protein